MSGATVYLVRHGESAANADPGVRRSDDPPLTPRGHEQAARAAAALARAGLDAVFSSPLRRARQTADAIASATGLVPAVLAGFAEVGMGMLTDPESPEGRAERDAIFSAWLAGDFRRGFPGGEGFADVVRRVHEALGAASRDPRHGRIAIVTHRMPIAAAAALAGEPTPPGGCRNGSVTTLRQEGDGWTLAAPPGAQPVV
jgi:broad specificity phosphatase PhoE